MDTESIQRRLERKTALNLVSILIDPAVCTLTPGWEYRGYNEGVLL